MTTVERRTAHAEQLPGGVTVEGSSLGGLAVKWDGRFIGWMHENGGLWKAVSRMPIPGTSTYTGRTLGSWPQAEAIIRIAREAGWVPQKKPLPPGRRASTNEGPTP